MIRMKILMLMKNMVHKMSMNRTTYMTNFFTSTKYVWEEVDELKYYDVLDITYH